MSGRRNVRTRNFRSQFEALPQRIRELAEKAFQTFLENPHHPVLGNHELKDTHRGRHRKHSRAVSISARYRALYVEDGDTNVWYWIGSHEDYNGFVGS